MKKPLPLLLLAAAFPCGLLLGGWFALRAPGTPKPSVAGGSPSIAPAPLPPEEPSPSTRRNSSRTGERLAASARGGADGLAASLRAARSDPSLLACLLATWRQKDPERLLRALAAAAREAEDAEEEAQELARTAGRLAEDMTRADPDAALRVVRGMEAGALRNHLLGAVVTTLFQRDPAKALETAAAYPGVRIDGSLDLDLVKISAERIPELRKLPRSGSKEDLLADALIDNFPPLEALAEAEKSEGLTRARVTAGVARNFAEKDMKGAMEQAVAADSFVIRAALRLAVGETLARRDPAAAARWAEEHLSAQEKNRVLNKAADALSKTDPAAAEEIRARVP